MKDFTWPSAFVFAIVVAGLVVLYGLSDDPVIRTRLIGHFDTIVPFIVGAAVGGSVGGAAGFARGKGLI